jgi:MoxR-like ATPase
MFNQLHPAEMVTDRPLSLQSSSSGLYLEHNGFLSAQHSKVAQWIFRIAETDISERMLSDDTASQLLYLEVANAPQRRNLFHSSDGSDSLSVEPLIESNKARLALFEAFVDGNRDNYIYLRLKGGEFIGVLRDGAGRDELNMTEDKYMWTVFESDSVHLHVLEQDLADNKRTWRVMLDAFFLSGTCLPMRRDYPAYRDYMLRHAGIVTKDLFQNSVVNVASLNILLDDMNVRFAHRLFFHQFYERIISESEAIPAVHLVDAVPSPHDLPLIVEDMISQLAGDIVGRDIEVRLLMLALLSGHHMLLLGEPGTAKSAIANNLLGLLTLAQTSDVVFFRYLMTKMSLPDEIFGPVSLTDMEKGKYTRQIGGYLPTATIAFLDEIFKANSAILNALLSVLNERVYYNGKEEVVVPLLSLIGASNEYPAPGSSLEALYDRFLFRAWVEPVVEPEEFIAMLHFAMQRCERLLAKDVECHVPARTLSVHDIRAIHQMRFGLDEGRLRDIHFEFLAELNRVLRVIHSDTSEGGFVVSNRRFAQITRIIQISALVHGRANEIAWADFMFLPHVLWQHHDQRENIRNIVCDLWATYVKKDVSNCSSSIEQCIIDVSGYLFETLNCRNSWCERLHD